jgi:hypothetical protein
MALNSSSTLHSIFVGLKYTVIISTLFRLSLCARLRTSSSWNRSILFVKMMSTSFTFRLSPPLSVNTWMLGRQSSGFQSINLLVKLHLTINFLALEGNMPVNSKAMLNHLAVSTNCYLFFYFDKNVKKTREQRMSSFSKFIYIKNCVVANYSNNKVILAVPILLSDSTSLSSVSRYFLRGYFIISKSIVFKVCEHEYIWICAQSPFKYPYSAAPD